MTTYKFTFGESAIYLWCWPYSRSVTGIHGHIYTCTLLMHWS